MVSKGAERFVLYPRYFDAKLSRAEGSRVSDALAVRGPDANWIENAARKLGLEPQVEEKKAHSALPHDKAGRVLVAKKGSKEAVIKMVAERMRASQDARSSE